MVGLIICNGYKTLGMGNCAKLSISLLFIYIFLRFLATRRSISKDEKECREKYAKVVDLTRNNVGMLILGQIIVFILMFLVTFAPVFSYAEKYPHAEDLIKKEFNISDSTLVLVKSFPAWYSEKIYANSETIYECENIMTQADLTDKARRSLINKKTNEYNKFLNKMTVRLSISLILFLIYGYCNTIIHARNAYTATMHSFEKKGKK